jgi:O-antigen ligase
MAEITILGKKILREQVSMAGYVLLATSIPFNRNMAAMLLLGFALMGLFWLNRQTWNRYFSWPLLAYYGLSLVAFLWTKDKDAGLFILTKQLPLLVVPAYFFIWGPPDANSKRWSLTGFALSNLGLAIWTLLGALRTFRAQGEYKVLFYHDLAAHGNMSALYFSLFAVFSILIFIREVFRPGLKLWMLGLLYAAILFLVLFVVLLASRASVLALFCMFGFTLIWFWKEKQAFPFKILFFVSFFFVVLATFSIPLLNQRFKEAINHENQFTLEKVGGGTSFRFAKWKSAWALVQENPLLGIGPGDVQEALNIRYLKDRHPQILNLNAHNQYLQTWLGLGLPGLIFLSVAFIYLIRRRKYASIGFAIVFSICILTESMLEIQKGILFFAFFYVLLLARPSGQKPV